MAVSGAKEKKSMPLCKAAGDHIPTASLWRHRIQPGKTRNRPRTRGTLVDIPFPKKARNEWLTAGRAERHHILPDSGWISIFSGKRPTWTGQSSSSTFHLRLPIKGLRNSARFRAVILCPMSLHFLLLAVAFLMSGVAFLASSSDSNPSTAENLRPTA